MGEQEKGFRVIDRRGGRGAEAAEGPKAAPEPPKAQGEGFVMADSPSEKREAGGSPEQMDFSTLVFSLATGAFIHMGLSPDPTSQRVEKNLPLAKQNIDILTLLQEKTRGNLSDDEARLLEDLLAETRLRYVEASR